MVPGASPLHAPIALAAGQAGVDWPLLAVLAVAAVASALVTGVALAAYVRRRSRPYLLVALAIAALLARTLVGAAVPAGWLGLTAHHLLEHGLDVAMAGLVVGAVYYARDVSGGETG